MIVDFLCLASPAGRANTMAAVGLPLALVIAHGAILCLRCQSCYAVCNGRGVLEASLQDVIVGLPFLCLSPKNVELW
jgi:hypothetical protein